MHKTKRKCIGQATQLKRKCSFSSKFLSTNTFCVSSVTMLLLFIPCYRPPGRKMKIQKINHMEFLPRSVLRKELVAKDHNKWGWSQGSFVICLFSLIPNLSGVVVGKGGREDEERKTKTNMCGVPLGPWNQTWNLSRATQESVAMHQGCCFDK